MDGIEWSRARWGKAKQALLWSNERAACYVGNQLIADHPQINTYLRTRARATKITTITYGSATVVDAPTTTPEELGLVPGPLLHDRRQTDPGELDPGAGAGLLAEAPVASSSRCWADTTRPATSTTPRSRQPRAMRSVFLGPIFEPEKVQSLRFHSLGLPAWTHGGRHQPFPGRGPRLWQPGHRARQRLQPVGGSRRGSLLHARRRT